MKTSNDRDSRSEMKSQSGLKPYLTLFVSLCVSYVVMFAIMYSRVNAFDNVFLSLNQVYMSGLMVSAMLLIMLIVMRSMYKNQKLNYVLLGLGTALVAIFLTLVRTQAGVGNQQFLHSMIPHHAAAILVCQQSSITDPRIQELCTEIVQTQKEEIRIMKELMKS